MIGRQWIIASKSPWVFVSAISFSCIFPEYLFHIQFMFMFIIIKDIITEIMFDNKLWPFLWLLLDFWFFLFPHFWNFLALNSVIGGLFLEIATQFIQCRVTHCSCPPCLEQFPFLCSQLLFQIGLFRLCFPEWRLTLWQSEIMLLKKCIWFCAEGFLFFEQFFTTEGLLFLHIFDQMFTLIELFKDKFEIMK